MNDSNLIDLFCYVVAAIHQFLLEVHINAWGLDRDYRALEPLEIQTDFIRDEMIFDSRPQDCTEDDNRCTPYNGQYDNLFFFFTHMYSLIHSAYDRDILRAYNRPIF